MDEWGGVCIERNDRISHSENAQRECGCEKTGKKLSIQRRKENEGNESSDSFAGGLARLFQVKEKRSPLRLNVFGREKGSAAYYWSSRTRKSCSAKPWKGVSHWKWVRNMRTS